MKRTSALLLALALAALAAAPAAPAPDAPRYRYVPVPRVKPGSTLFTYWDGPPDVAVSTDVFAFRDLQKSIEATDREGVRALRAAGRVLMVPVGTPVRVLQFSDGLLVEVPSYEVRVLDGTHQGKAGWVAASWVRWRVPAVPEKPAPKRKRR